MALSSVISMITVEPVMLLSNVATFMLMGVMQDLIYNKICLQNFDSDTCRGTLDNETLNFVQSEASSWLRYTNIGVSVPAILSSLYLGSWCSRYGSKIALLLPALGGVFSNLINIMVSVYMNTGIGYLIFSQFIAGVTGAGICVTMAAMSYVSLVSSVESRTARLSVVEAMMFLGGTVGPFIGGAMLERTSHAAVFLLILIINAINVVYVLIRVKNVRPNTQPEEASKVSHSCKDYFGPHHFVGTLTVCFIPREQGRRKNVLLLVFAATVVMLCTAGEQDITYLFAKDKPLLWSYETYSYFSGVKYGIGSFMLLFALPLARRWLNLSDTTLGFIGVCSKMFGLILLAFSTSLAAMFCVPLLAMFSTFPIPAIRALLSKLTEYEEHGKVFAFVACMENSTYLIAGVFFNSIYPLTRSFFNGFVFIFCAAILWIPILILGVVRRGRSNVDVAATPENQGYSTMAVDT